MREYVLALLVTAVVTYALVPVVRAMANRLGALAAVRERDVHAVPTPLLGGLAMYGGMAAGLLVASELPRLRVISAESETADALLLAGGLMVLVGAFDDRWGLSAFTKFAAQIAAGGILLYKGIQLFWVPAPNSVNYILTPQLAVLLTLLIVVATINAVNFIDGLDGLAAGIVGIAALAMLVYSYVLAMRAGSSRQTASMLIAVLLVGMCIGFLPYNFNPARIFMGDTGSMLIGLLLAATAITVTDIDPEIVRINRFPTILPLLLPAAVLAIPLADLVLAVVRRTSAGLSPFAPDKKHLHHRLLEIGHSHRRTVLIMYLWAALFAFAVVTLSIVKSALIVLAVASLVAILALVLMAGPAWRARNSSVRG